MKFYKITESRYISTDENYQISKLAPRCWAVSDKNEEGRFLICINRPFKNALEAMNELNKAGA